MMERIGFDQKIELDWLDKIAFKYMEEKDLKVVRGYMNEQIEYSNPGKESRRKSITVLQRIWGTVPENHRQMRDRALGLLTYGNGDERFLIHWGMSMLAYPFFIDVVSIIGRLFSLQNEFAVEQVHRRVVEMRGERSTLKWAVQRLVRSIYLWGALECPGGNGIYKPAPRRAINNKDIRMWLIEICLLSLGGEFIHFESLQNMPALFPFEVVFNLSEIQDSKKIIVNRQGLDSCVIGIRS